MSLIKYEHRDSVDIINDINEELIVFLNCQRSIDTAHVESIIKTQQEYYAEHKEYIFTNSIIFGEFKNRLYVLDGQHRLESIKRMRINQKLPCTVIKVNNRQEMQKYLLLINSNKPYVQVKSQDVKIIETFLSTTYKKYIKISKKPNRPHFRLNKVVEELNIYGPFNSTKFIMYFNLLNNELGDKPDSSLEFVLCAKAKCAKPRTNPFYLGVYTSDKWICKVMSRVNTYSVIKE
jgi:hypothetical protein